MAIIGAFRFAPFAVIDIQMESSTLKLREVRMLIILGGLPGSGKSTIAQALARRIGACYLRADTIEQAITSSAQADGHDVGPAGYTALYRLAADNLRLGQTVIADSVNPIEITRAAFRNVAFETDCKFIEVEVFCSDITTHRHRAGTRSPGIEGRANPTWVQIQERKYEPWSPDLRLDTFLLSVDESVAQVVKLL
ncbi:adenylylsulfate kinase [Agrobacterium radiobacter DSM 30147]|nr:adenylylsulfate kinase [Agrobacterium radiobacter DSM 30147]